MGRKQRKKKQKTAKRPKGAELEALKAMVARTDDTFEPMATEGWLGRCIHCNTKVYVSHDGASAATLEHIVPLTAGGTNDITNLALACASCNNDKGIRHDIHVGKRGRADEVVSALQQKRMSRFRSSE